MTNYNKEDHFGLSKDEIIQQYENFHMDSDSYEVRFSYICTSDRSNPIQGGKKKHIVWSFSKSWNILL